MDFTLWKFLSDHEYFRGIPLVLIGVDFLMHQMRSERLVILFVFFWQFVASAFKNIQTIDGFPPKKNAKCLSLSMQKAQESR